MTKNATHIAVTFYANRSFGFSSNYGLAFSFKDATALINVTDKKYKATIPYEGDEAINPEIHGDDVKILLNSESELSPYELIFYPRDPFKTGYKKNGVGCIVTIMLPLDWVKKQSAKAGEEARNAFSYFSSVFQLLFLRGFDQPASAEIPTPLHQSKMHCKWSDDGKSMHSEQVKIASKKFSLGYSLSVENFRPENKSLSADELNRLQDRLDSYAPILPCQEILLSGLSQYFVNKNDSSAVILFCAAIESLLQDVIVSLCKKKGLKKLDDGKTTVPISKVVTESIHKLFTHYLATVLSMSSLRNRDEYVQWKTHAYRLRNEVLHRGKVKIERGDVTKAYNATVRLMNFILSIIPKQHGFGHQAASFWTYEESRELIAKAEVITSD